MVARDSMCSIRFARQQVSGDVSEKDIPTTLALTHDYARMSLTTVVGKTPVSRMLRPWKGYVSRW